MSCARYFLNVEAHPQHLDLLATIYDRIMAACLFNHFVTRARAQAGLIRLHENVPDIGNEFDSNFLNNAVQIAKHPLNKPVLRNFTLFFFRFHPFNDCQPDKDHVLPLLEFFMPRSCDLFVDEFAFKCDFEAVEQMMGRNESRGLTSDETWSSLEEKFGGYVHPGKANDFDDSHVTVSDVTDPESGEVIQRKLTNWRKLLPNYDEMMQNNGGCEDEVQQAKPCSDLILVASLIDKGSNLGGLCRSADVFGLSTVILPSLDRCKDKDFESLSVSSHKWLKMVEVPPNQLNQFLISLQNDGYQLVAAEQATESSQLGDFQFQKKTALILGNEKEGIPPHILQMIDHCVEIPQYGFAVRSLNVHVTGALFMYSYSSQFAGSKQPQLPN